jgi:para-nitrobenzyl esterase
MKILKTTLLLFTMFFLFVSCNDDNEVKTNSTNEMVVSAAATNGVITEPNVTYAKGLKHQAINSSTYTVSDLQMDIYKPDNNASKRPAIILIHGGGFNGGSRTDPNIVNLANYFSSRGWVAFSISYRLNDDDGTVPNEWVTYAQNNLQSNQYQDLFKVYPAIRDAKAAIRWIMANADRYKIDKNYITVGGGSAGAVASVTIGISEPEDYTNEIPISLDPTISTIHKEQPYKIHTILDFWGSGDAVDLLKNIYGIDRYGSNDVPIFIAHGTNDTTVPFSSGEYLRNKYIQNGVNHVFYRLEGRGHGPWDATVNGKRLEELAFDFIVAQQKITVK